MSVSEHQPAIVAEDIHKSLGGEPIVEGLSVSVNPGTVTAIAGPNGVGKTVLVSCLAGALVPDAGSITRHGAAIPPHAVVFGPQAGLSLPGLTGRETIQFYRSLHPRATDRWQTLVTTFGMESALDDPVRTYSGGMQQLLSLSIVLSIDAPIVVLDEPTAALDPTARETVLTEIRSRTESGDTIILTTHSAEDLTGADRLLVLNETGIVADGPPEALRSALPTLVRTGDRNLGADVASGRTIYRDGVGYQFVSEDDEPLLAAPESRRTIDPTFHDLFAYYTETKPQTAGGRQ